MSGAEKVEIALIPLVAAGFWFMAPYLPKNVSFGLIVLGASGLLLFQSLMRDVWLLSQTRRRDRTTPQRAIRCMCAESTAGILGITLGILLLVGAGSHLSIALVPIEWCVLLVGVLGFGFLIKDLVIEASPWRIRRDKDHLNILVKWRS